MTSSTPIELIPSRVRCLRPHATAAYTARKTLSHDVLNASAVSFQLSRFAQRARNQAKDFVMGLLPWAQGTLSTLTPQFEQFTRLIE
jgi:hypothetical protein